MLIVASGGSEASDALQSLDPKDGTRLWWCRGAGDAASPAYGSGLVYFDSGRGGLGVAVEANGRGEVSRSHVRWTVPQVPEGIGSPIIVGEHVYRLHAPDILKCWSIEGGKTVRARRLEGISTTWASPIATPDGRIYFASAGKSYVVRAGPDVEVLGVNDLGDANHGSPAVAGGKMFLAGTKRLHAIGKK